MAKKNRKLEKQLEAYTLTESPPARLLTPALQALRAQKTENVDIRTERSGIRKRGFVLGGAAMVVLVLLVVGLALWLPSSPPPPSGNGDKPTVSYFSAADLTETTVQAAEAESLLSAAGMSDDILNIFAAAEQYTVHTLKETGDAVLITVQTRVAAGASIDELTVTVSLEGEKFYDAYKKALEQSAATYSGIEVYASERYEDGEYVTDAAFVYKDIQYYMTLMSPARGAVARYIPFLKAF